MDRKEKTMVACYLCGSKNLMMRKTVMSDFLYAKITGGGGIKKAQAPMKKSVYAIAKTVRFLFMTAG